MLDVRGETEAAWNELTQPDSSPESTSPSEPQAEAAVETPAPAISEPAPEASSSDIPLVDKAAPVAAEKPAGPIPFDRHKAILDGTRQEYESKLAQIRWAEGLNQQEVSLKLRLLEMAENDPEAFLERYQAALRQDPRYAQKYQQPAAPPEERPTPDVLLDNGQYVYSAGQQERLLAWQERQFQQQLQGIQQQVQPVLQDYQGQKAWNQALQRASGVLEQARSRWAGFKEAEGDIRSYMVQNRGASLDEAYRSVVVPKFQGDIERIRQDERQKVLAELKAKPSASTERPASAAPLARPRNDRGQWTRPGDLVREIYEELKERG